MNDLRRDKSEEDYDLLTYTEAGIRLAEEINREICRLASYEQADPPTEQSRRAAELVRRRLSALRDAQQRNARHALNDENFERFFGYPPSRRASGVS
jgi:hypothetical protein